jgi:hypothetical protein
MFLSFRFFLYVSIFITLHEMLSINTIQLINFHQSEILVIKFTDKFLNVSLHLIFLCHITASGLAHWHGCKVMLQVI